MKRIAIVGAGIAGLSTAYYLYKLSRHEATPLDIVVLEKEGRIGGSIMSARAGGLLIEGGPDCFLSEKPWALQLCRELGLEGEVVGTNQQVRRTFILWQGRLHELPEGFMLLAPTSPWPFVKSSLFSFTGKLRMGLDLVLPRKGPNGEESLAAFVRRRLGKEALERVAEPLVAGIHAGDPETMSLQSTFPRFIDLEHEHRSLIWGMFRRKKRFSHLHSSYTMFVTLKEGMEQMTAALGEVLPPRAIFLEGEVESSLQVPPNLRKVRDPMMVVRILRPEELLSEISSDLKFRPYVITKDSPNDGTGSGSGGGEATEIEDADGVIEAVPYDSDEASALDDRVFPLRYPNAEAFRMALKHAEQDALLIPTPFPAEIGKEIEVRIEVMGLAGKVLHGLARSPQGLLEGFDIMAQGLDFAIDNTQIPLQGRFQVSGAMHQANAGQGIFQAFHADAG